MKLRRTACALAVAALLCAPGEVRANGTQFFQAVGTAIAAFGGPYAWIGEVILLASTVVGGVEQRRKARRMAARARSLYNSTLADRSITALTATPPGRVVYGRAIGGGDVVAIFTSDKTGVREDGTAYTKADALKHLVVVVACHEVEAINEVYIEGVPVGALDGSGVPTGGEFKATAQDSRQVTFTGSVTVPDGPILSVLNSYQVTPATGGQAAEYTPQAVTVAGSTITGPVGMQLQVDYTINSVLASVRIQKHLGSDTQTVDAYLTGAVSAQWGSTDRLQGLAYCVITLDLEDTRFQGGPPNFTFDTSGRKLYDPRTGTTAFSTNNALCIRDYLLQPWGYEVDTADVDDASVIAAANACDATISLTVGGVTTTGPCYTCNGQFTTAENREAVLEDLVESMSGYAVYGAQWRLIAGAWTAPVMNLTDDDLDGQIEVVQAGAGIDDLFNSVRGTYIAAGKAQPTEFDTYQNAAFLAADGRALWTDLTLPFTDNRARARNIARTAAAKVRSGQVIRYPAKLRAWPLQTGDRVTVTSAEYGFNQKTYMVTDWQFGIDRPVLLTLQEDVASTWGQADAATADPSPNTDLPNPWRVGGITGLAATSGTAQLQRTADGTVLARVLVTWSGVSSAYVADGSGRIELLWRRPGSLQFQQQVLPGDATSGWIEQVAEGDLVVIEVRAVNGLGVRGPSSFLGHTVIGKTALPADVAGLTAALQPGGALISWTASTEADYYETEVRVGASWAAGTTIFRGRAAPFVWQWPTAGSYTLRAKHRDTTGNESATDATLGLTVSSAILIGTAQLGANAATDVYVANALAVTITGQTGSPFGTVTSVATVSFTANVTGDALITCAGGGTNTTPASGVSENFGRFRSSLWVQTNGGGYVRDTSSTVNQFDLDQGYATTRNFGIYYSKRLAVVAGSTYDVAIYGQKFAPGNTCTVDNLELRAEIIKR